MRAIDGWWRWENEDDKLSKCECEKKTIDPNEPDETKMLSWFNVQDDTDRK